jgi:hypothetical protein
MCNSPRDVSLVSQLPANTLVARKTMFFGQTSIILQGEDLWTTTIGMVTATAWGDLALEIMSNLPSMPHIIVVEWEGLLRNAHTTTEATMIRPRRGGDLHRVREVVIETTTTTVIARERLRELELAFFKDLPW